MSMDLSKVFYTLNYDLLIAKIHEYGVTQKSFLGSYLFIYITKVCNFVDDTKFHGNDLNALIIRLQHDVVLTLERFENNNMNYNNSKCHSLISGNKHENVRVKIGEDKVW